MCLQTFLSLDVTENQKLLTGRSKYALNIRVTLRTIKKGAKVTACITAISRIEKILQLQGNLTNDHDDIIMIDHELSFTSVC